jgi:essential nuclear protein 1
MANTVDTLDGKIVDAFRKIGVVLKTYRSGKLPKAFKIVPMVANWEELLLLTIPEKWSSQATLEATLLFLASRNKKMIQRFFSVILLPTVR